MIQARNLTKTFGPKVAVDGISFTLEKGEVLGFLGPNGAGKSTTMRMVTGFIPPTSGEITVGPHDISREPIAARRLIGYLPENAPSYSDMAVLGFLRFAAEMRGLSGAAKDRAVSRAAEMCFLEPVLHQSIDTLSKGYRHRICFAQSIIHDPEILILDEPTDGLDPNQKHEVRALIKDMGKNKAIIFSTHILEEVEAACTRALIIDRGRIVANGTPAELKARSPESGAVTIQLGGSPGNDATKKLRALAGVERIATLYEKPLRVRLYPSKNTPAADLARAILQAASTHAWQIEDLRVEEGRLDDVFRSITLPDTTKAPAK
jgi:ABC-2 type transport system ATP-binding protein